MQEELNVNSSEGHETSLNCCSKSSSSTASTTTEAVVVETSLPPEEVEILVPYYDDDDDEEDKKEVDQIDMSVCMDPKCQREIANELEDAKAQNIKIHDSDYEMFHCSFCHSLSHGKTSYHCRNCGRWACQPCANGGSLCPRCIKLPKYLYKFTKKWKRKHPWGGDDSD